MRNRNDAGFSARERHRGDAKEKTKDLEKEDTCTYTMLCPSPADDMPSASAKANQEHLMFAALEILC